MRKLRQSGAALLAMLLILMLFAVTYTVRFFQGTALAERNARLRIDHVALNHAREAVIGSAITYRDTHPNEVFGHLRCPDLTNEKGEAAAPCGARDLSSLGRLPWKTLGLPALRDHAGECLWYAVSGRAKNNPKTTVFNWDTTGQFIVRDAAGNILAGASPHQRPLALILAPGFASGGQIRPYPSSASPTPNPPSECGGSASAAGYLESIGDAQGDITPITLSAAQTPAAPATANNNHNNDTAAWISSDDIFRRIMRRRDFGQDIDVMLDDFAACLGNWPTAELPPTSATAKGLLDAATLCPPAALDRENNVRGNWEDQLLYARPAVAAQVHSDGNAYDGCAAILLFGGMRTAWQSRADDGEKSNPAMYLEDGNAALFPAGGLYVGGHGFTPNDPSRELLRCIRGLPPHVQQISLAGNLDEFLVIGTGLEKKKDLPVAPANPATRSGKSSITFSGNDGLAAGCLWHPQPLPLAGRRWRIYYSFRFELSDTHATAANQTTADRGKGFTLQIVRGDRGVPDNCGALADMGVLGPADPRGASSLLIETDVHQDGAHNDPPGNHSAILLNGDLRHDAALGADCNGSVGGCRHTPASKFEDTPMATHNQRIEIHTGCDGSCSDCDPAAHGSGGRSHARIKIWIDCRQCLGIRADLPAGQAASLARCIALPEELETAYFGFTGGFLPSPAGAPGNAAPRQAVSIGNFYLGVE